MKFQMPLIKIDNDMLISELFAIRAQIEDAPDAARRKLDDLLTLISHAPLAELKSQYPRSAGRRG